MKKASSTKVKAAVEQPQVQVTAEVHPMQKSYMFISTKHVDYNNLSAFESVTMSLALVLSITLGLLTVGA